MRRFVLLTFFLSISIKFSLAQINAYAKVTAVSGSDLTLSNVNETYHTFEDGDWIVIMQMQDNVIGANTGSNANFGNLGSIQSAAIEDSNVDLSQELVNMIMAQRVYQANAQTIKTQDQVLQTLVNLR